MAHLDFYSLDVHRAISKPAARFHAVGVAVRHIRSKCAVDHWEKSAAARFVVSGGHVGAGANAMSANRSYEFRVIAFRLVGIGAGKFLDRFFEGAVLSHVAGDFCRISGSRMAASERPAAELDVFDEIYLRHRGDVDLHFHVAKLTEIVVAVVIVTSPTEKHIARGLQHALPCNNT